MEDSIVPSVIGAKEMHLQRNEVVEAWLNDGEFEGKKITTFRLLRMINPRNEFHIIGYDNALAKELREKIVLQCNSCKEGEHCHFICDCCLGSF
jgi:hypothetical protein